MKPVKQTITKSRYANCLQATVASYFEMDLEMVPNFMLFKEKYWEAVYWWFFSQGYDIGFVDGLPPNDGKYYIASVDYGKDYNHAVIYKDGDIVHDPGPNSVSRVEEIIGYYSIMKKYQTKINEDQEYPVTEYAKSRKR